ncbi:MAG: GLPGLI family protein [Saprospiraceae bacterium]|nr:GLPGLI family protein [Saprospiraceae bacterium]
MICKKCLFILIVLITCNLVHGQIQLDGEEVTRITYFVTYNGQTDNHQNPIYVLSDGKKSLITNQSQIENTAKYPREMTLVLPNVGRYDQYAFLADGTAIRMSDTSSIDKQEWVMTDETKTILGYRCKKAQTTINSNTIVLWYTDELPYHAAPSILGQRLGVVLEQVRNGNFAITARDISKIKLILPEYITATAAIKTEKLDYTDRIWRSRFTTIPVFDHQQIHWSETYEPREDVLRFANGTIVVKKVTFPKILSSQQVFVELTEQSTGDAYDRTGTVFLIPTDKKQSFMDGLQNGASTLPIYENGNGKKYQGVIATAEYSPVVELMRFFTPFGINHFNDRVTLKGKTWHTTVPYRQEITALAGLMSGQEVYIGVFIGNYDKGGHTISMDITIHNDGAGNQPLPKAIPLFNTLNIMEMAGQDYGTMFDNDNGLVVQFALKEPLKNAKLRYVTTGHGGWENGDEFVQKKNTILLDKKVVFDLIPWREDCGSYRLYNPVSGNFSNGLSSSDYSRSNWCPGTVTNPYIISLGDLTKGEHTIQVKIPQGHPEGNSFSAWNVSGILIGE